MVAGKMELFAIMTFTVSLCQHVTGQQGFAGQQTGFQAQHANQFGAAGQGQNQIFSNQQPPNQFQQGPSGAVGPFGQQPPLGSPGFQQPGGGNVAGALGVKIIGDLLPWDKVNHVPQVNWQEPMSLPLYCISSGLLPEIKFRCASCDMNNSLSNSSPSLGSFHPAAQSAVDLALQASTTDLTNAFGVSAIKLNPMTIRGEDFDRQRIQCVGYATTGSGERLNFTAETSVSVYYLARPRIVDQLDHGPIFVPNVGFRFYAPQASVLNLKCLARGNPPPTAYQWRVSGGNVVSQSPQYAIPNNLQQPIMLSCRAAGAGSQSSGSVNWQTSDDVVVEPLIGPGIKETNFESVARSGIKDPNTGKVTIGQTANLQCIGGASSRPFVVWLHQTSAGRISNATCEGGSRTTDSQPQNNLVMVTSTCSILLNTFEKSGDYWCSACSYTAENSSLCNPTTNVYSNAAINFDLTGPPMISPYFRIERQPPNERTTLYFTYCADTLPAQNEIFFTMEKERLGLNSRMTGNTIQSGNSQQNQTFTRCQDIPLMFENNAALARYQTVYLNIHTANLQPIQQSFFIQSAVNGTYIGYFDKPFEPLALILGIVLGIAFLVTVFAIVCCWYRKILCFGMQRPGPKTTKIGGGPSKPTKYQPGMPSSQLRPDVPQEKVVPLSRSNNGFGNDRPLPGGSSLSYSPPKKSPHEGLTYSEFDLVKDSNRLVPSNNRVVEYSRLPINPASVKSPTNSIV